MAGFLTNGVTLAAAGGTYPAVNGYELTLADTNKAAGQAPQTVAVSTFQIAALAAAIAKNTATATSGAATLSTEFGTITSESLTTAASANYTLTLTNTLAKTTSTIQAAAYLGSSTTGGPVQLVSITPAAGSVVIVVKNTGTAALNGTLVVPFQIF